MFPGDGGAIYDVQPTGAAPGEIGYSDVITPHCDRLTERAHAGFVGSARFAPTFDDITAFRVVCF
jgi:hypothetical protein